MNNAYTCVMQFPNYFSGSFGLSTGELLPGVHDVLNNQKKQRESETHNE